ncbi:MAG: hypothetical protein V3T01_15235 [Myxococcota bacterium]
MRSVWEIAELLLAGVVPSLAYLAVGLWMLRPLRLEPRGAERFALAFLLGSGVVSLAILALRLVDAPLPLVLLAAVAAAGLPRVRSSRPTGDRSPRAAWIRCIDALAIGMALLTFLAALGPETSWDGFEYHLPMIQAWSEGPIRALPGMLDAEFRAGIDLLYLPAVAAGAPDAAAAVSAAFALALAALVRAEVTRRGSPGAGALAGLFVLMVPFALDAAPTTYVDLGVGAYGFLALASADRWNRTGDSRALTVSAACLVFAANAKLHAFVLCPAVLTIVLLGGRRPSPRLLLASTGLVLVGVAPWLLKAAVTSGNPFFPFLGHWLGTGPTTEQVLSLRRFRLSTDFAADPDLRGLLRYLASIHFGNNPHVSGLIGPLPLALAPFALHRVSRSTAVLAATLAILIVAQFVFMPALRFGSPVLPFLAIAAGVGGMHLAHSGSAARIALGVVFAALAIHQGLATAAHYLPRVAALRSPENYERRIFPDQVALGEIVARGSPVVAIPMGAVLWMPKPVYNLLWERNGELFFRGLRGGRGDERHAVRSATPEDALALLERRGVRSLVLDVRPPHPGDGRVGNPIVDAWLANRVAKLRPDPDPPRARGDRVWVLVDLMSTDVK